MSKFEQREAAIRFPFCVADNTDGNGVQRVAVSGSAQTYALKDFQRGKYVKFTVDASGTALTKVQVAAATSAQTLVINQASSAAAGTSSAAAGATVFAGGFVDGILPNAATHIAFIGDAAGGYVDFYISEVVER